MAAVAAVAGAGVVADFLNGGKRKSGDGLDNGLFSDLQAMADQLRGTILAGF
jgi:hypothetical protein